MFQYSTYVEVCRVELEFTALGLIEELITRKKITV